MRQKSKLVSVMNPTRSQLSIILLALGICLFAPIATLAQALPLASWVCGDYGVVPGYSNTPVSFGTEISDHNQWLTPYGRGYIDHITDAQLHFSLRAYTYDANDKVTGSETVVRPSAEARAYVMQSGVTNCNITWATFAASVEYYGRIAAKPGAPAGAAVPLRVRMRGWAKATNSDDGPGYKIRSDASASSCFSCPPTSAPLVQGQAYVSSMETYGEYDQSRSVGVYANAPFFCSVRAMADAQVDYAAPAVSSAYAEAFADPTVEIDPSYQFADYFSLEFSDNILFTPPEPLVLLSLQRNTDGTGRFELTGPTNHVFVLEVTTNLVSRNWLPILELTNFTGTALTAIWSNTGDATARFFRARVDRKIQ